MTRVLLLISVPQYVVFNVYHTEMYVYAAQGGGGTRALTLRPPTFLLGTQPLFEYLVGTYYMLVLWIQPHSDG